MNRYSRQIAIPEIGTEGQKKLLESRVFVLGCGALGSMVSMQLAGAGIGKLTIADFDNIEISNLQRQFFFKTEEAGLSKAEVLKGRIEELNPDTSVEYIPKYITGKIAEEEFGKHDFIVDATDNPESKRLVDVICREKRLPCCIGGVREFSGQVITLLPDDNRFEEIFGEGASQGFLPCSLGGVAGPAASLCASIQASEVIKYLTSCGQILSGRLFLFNLLTNQFNVFPLF